MSPADGFRFFAKYYEANKTDDDTTVEHVARRECTYTNLDGTV